MRFLKIGYRRFGPFENKVFDVSGGEYGLHVFYGPNEAGKSTALRGLTYLLFGLPQSRREDFHYEAREQALEAHLRDSRGEELRFVRVRGRNQLRAVDGGEDVTPARLGAFLGGLTREQFEMLFGLDHSRLVEGGRQIVEGHGSLGEALFSAGAGLVGLRRRQDALVERCNRLYRPRANNPVINQLLASIAETDRRQRAAMLHVETWRQQVEAYHETAAQKNNLERERREIRAEIDRINNFLKVLPSIRRWRELREELDKLPPRDAILDEQSVVGELRAALGACLKALRDRSQLVRQSEEKKHRALILLRNHFQRDDLEQAEGLSLSAATKRRIQDLSRESKASWEAKETAATNLANFARQAEDLKRRLDVLPALPEIARLEAVCNSVSSEGPLEQQLRQAEARLAQLQSKAQTLLSRLESCWRGSLEEAATLRVPARERIAEFAREFQRLDEERREVDRILQEHEKTIREAERAMEQLERGGPIPNAEALAQARADRDAGLRWVRTAWLEPERLDRQQADAFIARHAPRGHLLDALESSIRQCDELADRLRREAQRVADREAHERRRAEATAERERHRQRADALRQAASELAAAWEREWRPCRIQPRPPGEMTEWLLAHAELLDLVPEIRRGQCEVEQLRGQIDSARRRLRATLDLEADHPDTPLSELIELARHRIAEVHKQAELRRNLENQLAEARRRHREAEEASAAAEARLERWAAEWREAIRALGADPHASPEAIQGRLDQLDEILSERRQAAELDQRVRGIDRDREAFLRRLNELRARLDPGCSDSTVESMQADVDALEARLNGARETETQRQARKADAERLHDEIMMQAGNQSFDAFCDEVLRQAETFPSRLAELREREHSLDAEIAELSEKTGRAKNQLEAWDRADCEAAQLRQDRAALLSRLRQAVLEYAACSLARVILRRAMESFRQRHQGSMLDRANEYFRELTGGAFDRLEVDETEPGALVLKAVRAASDGQSPEYVSVEGLSDGTRDQLFLALRLAGVEEHLAQCEPMPIIVDDILVNFDDARAAATLRCLAKLSRRTQVLLFTHHAHVVDIAKTHVPSEVLFCHAF